LLCNELKENRKWQQGKLLIGILSGVGKKFTKPQSFGRFLCSTFYFSVNVFVVSLVELVLTDKFEGKKLGKINPSTKWQIEEE
jgi:hypothetical protein